MTARKFDPVKEFAGLRDSLSQSLGQSLGVIAGKMYPPVDIYETDESVIVRTAPMDGELDNVEVTMEDDLLLITGTTQPEGDVPGVSYLQRERRFGKFSRVLRIPRTVNAEQAVAQCKKGTLTITLPKVGNNLPDDTEVET
jgi:HSP20 family protein